MLIDTQELAERLHSGCDGLGVAREVAAVIDLMQHRLGIGIMRLDGNKGGSRSRLRALGSFVGSWRAPVGCVSL
ncbi:hypothetical protein D3C73_753100 [compost metagenome]